MKELKVRDEEGNVKNISVEKSEAECRDENNSGIIHSLIWGAVIISAVMIVYFMIRVGKCGC